METEHFDDLEIRDPAARERALMAALPDQIAHARDHAPHYAQVLKDIEPQAVTTRAALAALPVTRKSEMIDLQRAAPPFGGLTATPPGRLRRVFQSPGPIYDAEGHGRDPWRTARALHVAGVRPGDLVHNAFAYHLTPAGAMVESGAHALGAAVFPAGTGNTELQVRAVADLRPSAYAGTPSFLRVLLDKGREMEADVSSLQRASVAGEALPASLRAELKAAGIFVLQWYATADLGLIAYETPALEGLVVDEGVIVEIVRPGTGDPVPEGEVGEVVVTTFDRDYPLVRFATGDLSAVLPGVSPCGRTNMRIKGWMGRADQTTKVKGMFVHPSQIAQVVRRHPEIIRARLVVTQEDGTDVMLLRCEAAEIDPVAIAETVQAVCKLRGRVEIAAPGSLPNDGRVIEDARRYD